MTEFSGILAEESDLLDIDDFTQLEMTPLMWQTGYFTIRGIVISSFKITSENPLLGDLKNLFYFLSPVSIYLSYRKGG